MDRPQHLGAFIMKYPDTVMLRILDESDRDSGGNPTAVPI